MSKKLSTDSPTSPTGRIVQSVPEFQRLPLFPRPLTPKKVRTSFFEQDFSQLEARVSAFMAMQSICPKK